MPQLPSPFHRPISGTPAAGRIKRCHVMAKGERVAGKGGVPLVNFFSRKQSRKKKLMKEVQKNTQTQVHMSTGAHPTISQYEGLVGWFTRFNPGLPAQLSKGTFRNFTHLSTPKLEMDGSFEAFQVPNILTRIQLNRATKKKTGSLTFHEILVVE